MPEQPKSEKIDEIQLHLFASLPFHFSVFYLRFLHINGIAFYNCDV